MRFGIIDYSFNYSFLDQLFENDLFLIKMSREVVLINVHFNVQYCTFFTTKFQIEIL